MVRPKGKKGAGSGIELLAGVELMDKLPIAIELPWKRFDAAANELQKLRHGRANAQAEETHAALDESEQSASNTDSDDRWRAFEQWNRGAAGLADDGDTPSPAEARRLYAQLFPAPDGLRFITRRPRAQWAAMVRRMSVLAEDRAQTVISGFGGTRHCCIGAVCRDGERPRQEPPREPLEEVGHHTHAAGRGARDTLIA